MTRQVVIEGLGAYETFRKANPTEDLVWWTTSPYLLTSLPLRGELVRSPEEGLPQDLFDSLALAASDLGNDFCKWYQDACAWRGYIQFRFVLAHQLTRCAFVTWYKALLLSRIVAHASGSPVVCVGHPGEPDPPALSLTYGRLDTLFSALASKSKNLELRAFPHLTPSSVTKSLEEFIRHRPFGGIEKVLSVLNNTPSSLTYKIWKNLAGISLCPSRLSLLPVSRKTFWIHKDCELIEEAAFGILLRGGRIARLEQLPPPGICKDDGQGPSDSELVEKQLGAIAIMAMKRYSIPWNEEYSAASKLVTSRSLLFLGQLQRNYGKLNASFDRITARIKPEDEILTSALTSPMQGLFYSFCRKRGINVSAFEHGVTLGLSDWSDVEARQAGMLAADRAFYHCPRAAETTRPHATWQDPHVVGLPRCTVSPILRGLQRRLGRRLLGIGIREHVIMHIADLERNNFVYGPYQENDLKYFIKTRQVTQALCKAFPTSRVVLKLYPTQRYIDAYDFSDLASEHPNLLVVKDIDFRFIRACSDWNFTSSSQSTLGWVEGAGAPMTLLEYEWTSLRVTGLRLQWPSVEGLSSMILPDRGAVCLSSPRDVSSELMKAVRPCVA